MGRGFQKYGTASKNSLLLDYTCLSSEDGHPEESLWVGPYCIGRLKQEYPGKVSVSTALIQKQIRSQWNSSKDLQEMVLDWDIIIRLLTSFHVIFKSHLIHWASQQSSLEVTRLVDVYSLQLYCDQFRDETLHFSSVYVQQTELHMLFIFSPVTFLIVLFYILTIR